MVDFDPGSRITSASLGNGCYLHGIFASDAFRFAFLSAIRRGRQSEVAYDQLVENTLDQLANHVEKYLDLDQLLAIAKAH